MAEPRELDLESELLSEARFEYLSDLGAVVTPGSKATAPDGSHPWASLSCSGTPWAELRRASRASLSSPFLSRARCRP
eukprot:10964851-Alexandrium_andersonii.AAC.1